MTVTADDLVIELAASSEFVASRVLDGWINFASMRTRTVNWPAVVEASVHPAVSSGERAVLRFAADLHYHAAFCHDLATADAQWRAKMLAALLGELVVDIAPVVRQCLAPGETLMVERWG